MINKNLPKNLRLTSLEELHIRVVFVMFLQNVLQTGYKKKLIIISKGRSTVNIIFLTHVSYIN
jgi:hypothetical protein